MSCENSNSRQDRYWNESENSENDSDSNENQNEIRDHELSRPAPPPLLPPVRLLPHSQLMRIMFPGSVNTSRMTPEERLERSTLILEEALAIILGDTVNGRPPRAPRENPPNFPPTQ